LHQLQTRGAIMPRDATDRPAVQRGRLITAVLKPASAAGASDLDEFLPTAFARAIETAAILDPVAA